MQEAKDKGQRHDDDEGMETTINHQSHSPAPAWGRNEMIHMSPTPLYSHPHPVRGNGAGEYKKIPKRYDKGG